MGNFMPTSYNFEPYNANDNTLQKVINSYVVEQSQLDIKIDIPVEQSQLDTKVNIDNKKITVEEQSQLDTKVNIDNKNIIVEKKN